MIVTDKDGKTYELTPIEKAEVQKDEQSQYDDLRKLIVRCKNIIAIKWDKLLKSFPDGDIEYGNDGISEYTDYVSFEEVTLDKLVPWDVFVFYHTRNIGYIFLWKNTHNSFILQRLNKLYELEYIYHIFYENSLLKNIVIKALRN